MKPPAFLLTLAIAVVGWSSAARAADVDVVVQAGHQGRPASCAPLHVKACNLGAASPLGTEREWTPIVADSAAKVLRAAGLRVMRRPADYAGHDTARAAVFLHFDGSVTRCASGASIGFPPTTARAFVHDWERTYHGYFPYKFSGENITSNEANYYGFRKVTTPGRAILIEFGEITCPAQAAWMKPRLRALGQRLATFLIAELKR